MKIKIDGSRKVWSLELKIFKIYHLEHYPILNKANIYDILPKLRFKRLSPETLLPPLKK